MRNLERAKYSETSAWITVGSIVASLQEVLRRARSSGWNGLRDQDLVRGLAEIDDVASAMLGQLGQDPPVHANPRRRNPALVLYGNPPGQQTVGVESRLTLTLKAMLGFVEKLDYQRVRGPKGYYFHDFGPSDTLWCADLHDGQRIVVVANEAGRPLWAER